MYVVSHSGESVTASVVVDQGGQTIPDCFHLEFDDAYGFGPNWRLATRAETLVALYEFSNPSDPWPNGIPGLDYNFGQYSCQRQFGDVSYCELPGCKCPFGPTSR